VPQAELAVVRAPRRLEQLLKRYNRGEVAPVEWLDHLTLARIQQLRVQVLPRASPAHRHTLP
jgi:hypothetical protein